MNIRVPMNISDQEATKIAKQQGCNTIVSISHLPDGTTSINAF